MFRVLNPVISATILAAALSAGCTSFRPAELSVDEIQSSIAGGGLVSSGDRIRLTTADGQVHKLRVDAVDPGAGVLTDGGSEIRITEIVAFETRELSWIKTGFLIGGLVLVLSTDCEDDPSCDGPFGGTGIVGCC